MSDPTEFKEWIDQIDQQDTIEIDRLIEHKVKTLRRKKHIRWVAVPLSSFLSLVITFALLVNLNDAFYVYALNTPVLSTLTKLVNGRQDILSAFDSGYVQLIDQTIMVGDYTLELDSIISDTRTINIFYKISYKGEYLKEDVEEQFAPFDFLTADGQQMTAGYGIKHYESYRWAEVFLGTLNNYQPFILRFMPYGQDSAQVGDLTITVNQTKVIEPKFIQINKTVVVSGQKLILQSLEVGAFQSRLMYYPDPNNEKLVNLITFKDAIGTVYTSAEEMTVKTRFQAFGVGQLSKQKSLTIELAHASVLDRKFEFVIFDPKTRTFDDLPEYLTLIDVKVEGNDYELIMDEKQSVSNQIISPISMNVVDGRTWGATKDNGFLIGFKLTNDLPVTFRTIGGTEVTEFPAPITIKLP